MSNAECGCGKPVRYTTTTGAACNKYSRCLTRDEILQRFEIANALLIEIGDYLEPQRRGQINAINTTSILHQKVQAYLGK